MNAPDPIRFDMEPLADELRAAGATVKGRAVKCCFHDDKTASGSIYQGKDGAWRYKCHVCDTGGDVYDIRAMNKGAPLADVLREAHTGQTQPAAPRPGGNGKGKAPKTYPTAEAAIADVERFTGGTLAGCWTYPGGAFKVARFNRPGEPKTFRPLYKSGDGWIVGDPPGLLSVYRSDELPQTGPVVDVEGERCADTAWEIGLPAVTSAHGAKSADKTDWTPLAGRTVYILPDADEAGRRYAEEVATILHGLTPPASVKIVPLPGLGDGGDIVDWISADGPMGCKEPEEIRAAILALAEAAPVWTPPHGAHTHETPEKPGDSSVVCACAPAPAPVEPWRPLPLAALPEPFRGFISDGAEAIGCDPAFLALPLLSGAAAAIGNARRIELKRGWREPAIIWTAIVGESGTLKSPAMELPLRPIRARQLRAAKKHAEALAEYRKKCLRYDVELSTWKKAKGKGEPPDEPLPPILPRYICDDTTIEALAALLGQNWRGLLVARDELGAWLGGFDQYREGRGNDAAKWCEMHGGRALTVDRKSGNPPTIYIPRAAVSITGGVQPATLARALTREHFESGLAARLLLACPPRKVKRWTEADTDPAREDELAAIFGALYGLEPAQDEDGEPTPAIVRLDPDAKRAFVDFYNGHAEEQVDLSGDLAAAWSKLEGYAARLALVIHFIRFAACDPLITNPDLVDAASVEAGAALSNWFGYEARRVYRVLDESAVERDRAGLVELIRRRGGTMTPRDLMLVSRRQYPTADLAEGALMELKRAGLGQWETPAPGQQGGRPAFRFVLSDKARAHTTPENAENPGVLCAPTGGQAPVEAQS
jgi:hypothetical protein